MQTFPSYDLETNEEIHDAIEDMTARTGKVASVEERSELVENSQ